jgi:NADH-quinone oxidoreductase subunit J
VLTFLRALILAFGSGILLIDPPAPDLARRFSALLIPGVLACVALFAVFGWALWQTPAAAPGAVPGAPFGLAQFAAAFLSEYWLHFELTSVLLVAAVVAAIAIIDINRRERG